jgi:hypothetical protein
MVYYIQHYHFSGLHPFLNSRIRTPVLREKTCTLLVPMEGAISNSSKLSKCCIFILELHDRLSPGKQ